MPTVISLNSLNDDFVNQTFLCSALGPDIFFNQLTNIYIISMYHNNLPNLHSKKILYYVIRKRSTDLLVTKILPKLHHTLMLLSELFTIFNCNSPLIMVQLRTNFCSRQISASFWCNIGQNFFRM